MDNNNMNQLGTDQQYQQPTYQQYQQPVYQQPAYQQYQQEELERPMSVGDWMVTTLIMCIPCVNFIMIFVWAFGSNTNKSKANFFKASLIWSAIYIGLVLIMSIIFAVMGISIAEYAMNL